MKASLVILGGLLAVAGIWTSAYTQQRTVYAPDGSVLGTELVQPYEGHAFTLLLVGVVVVVIGAVVNGSPRPQEVQFSSPPEYIAPEISIERHPVKMKIMVRCSSCGTLNDEDEDTCVGCGAALKPPTDRSAGAPGSASASRVGSVAEKQRGEGKTRVKEKRRGGA
ncbi:MAG: hypothetical protein OEW84_01890 [Aigarchaeota archaeon]|nr:hypothetical protein [Aigarchaeota archaeon]